MSQLTREKKIKVLTDIQSGRKTIKDIMPEIHEIWWSIETLLPRSQYIRDSEEDPALDIALNAAVIEIEKDGIQRFLNKETKEVLTREQLTDREQKDKRNINYYTIVHGRMKDKPRFVNTGESISV